MKFARTLSSSCRCACDTSPTSSIRPISDAEIHLPRLHVYLGVRPPSKLRSGVLCLLEIANCAYVSPIYAVSGCSHAPSTWSAHIPLFRDISSHSQYFGTLPRSLFKLYVFRRCIGLKYLLQYFYCIRDDCVAFLSSRLLPHLCRFRAHD